MKRLKCDSDIGSCLIGNKYWTFAIPNRGGDGTTYISIFKGENSEFRQYKIKHELVFISSVQGTFNIYSYDCAFTDNLEDYILITLSGRYGVYQGNWEVVFVKWE